MPCPLLLVASGALFQRFDFREDVKREVGANQHIDDVQLNRVAMLACYHYVGLSFLVARERLVLSVRSGD